MRDFNESEYAPRRFYDGMARFADEAIQNVTQALKARGMFNNTIMIVTTDNGGSYDNGNNYPLRGAKYDYFDGGVRGSAFVYSELLPESVRGSTYEGLMHISDWYPTICSLAGVSYNDSGLHADHYDDDDSIANDGADDADCRAREGCRGWV